MCGRGPVGLAGRSRGSSGLVSVVELISSGAASFLCAPPQQPVKAGCRLAARVLLRSSMPASFLCASVSTTQPAEAGCQLAARAVER